jgi:hypothetical protein
MLLSFLFPLNYILTLFTIYIVFSFDWILKLFALNFNDKVVSAVSTGCAIISSYPILMKFSFYFADRLMSVFLFSSSAWFKLPFLTVQFVLKKSA